MCKPKVGEVWWVDLSPVVGAELGGIRRCKILKVFNDELYQIVPYSIFHNYDGEPMWEHVRSVSIERFRGKLY